MRERVSSSIDDINARAGHPGSMIASKVLEWKEGKSVMSVKNIKKLIISAFAAIFLVSGVIATTAEAQDKTQRRPHRPRRIIIYRPYNPFWYRYDPFWDPFRYDYRVVDPIAYQRERGYSEG